MPRQRPIGVTILAILSFLGGLFEIFAGLGMMALAAISGTIDPAVFGPLAAFMGIIGILLLILGLVTMVVAIGLWRMRAWAWWVAIIVNIVSLAINAASYSWTGLVLPLIIVIYLVVIRDKFGIGAPKPAGM
jgi:lysylphosphatidylglycerol synthetase-like protein (DUF2156 family)